VEVEEVEAHSEAWNMAAPPAPSANVGLRVGAALAVAHLVVVVVVAGGADKVDGFQVSGFGKRG
jgi:hypothetical protein